MNLYAENLKPRFQGPNIELAIEMKPYNAIGSKLNDPVIYSCALMVAMACWEVGFGPRNLAVTIVRIHVEVFLLFDSRTFLTREPMGMNECQYFFFSEQGQP
jgi:hypothetical protein